VSVAPRAEGGPTEGGRAGSGRAATRTWPCQDGWRARVAPGVELATSSCPSERPDGHVFVCIHGLASNRRLYDEVASWLVGSGFGVLTVDLRGHGGSSAPEGGYDLATVVSDLQALLRTLDWCARPIVVGQSWGGNVAVELAIALGPSRCRGVVAIDGGTIELSSAFSTFEECLAALDPPELSGLSPEQLRQYIAAAHPDFSPAGVEAQLANFTVVDGRLRPHLDRPHHHEILADLWEHHPSERWALLRSPLLLMPAVQRGTPTGEAKLAAARLAAERAAGPVSIEVFFDGDHDLHLQHPSRVAAVLERFDAEVAELERRLDGNDR